MAKGLEAHKEIMTHTWGKGGRFLGIHGDWKSHIEKNTSKN